MQRVRYTQCAKAALASGTRRIVTLPFNVGERTILTRTGVASMSEAISDPQVRWGPTALCVLISKVVVDEHANQKNELFSSSQKQYMRASPELIYWSEAMCVRDFLEEIVSTNSFVTNTTISYTNEATDSKPIFFLLDFGLKHNDARIRTQ